MTGPGKMTITVTMKPEIVRAGEFKAKCLQLMDRVAATGRSVVITKRGKPVVEVVPAVRKLATLRGFMRDHIEIAGDVVAPVELDWNAER